MEARLSWLTDPAVFRVGRLDAHSDHVCYASAEEAVRGETSLRQSLDGAWRFAWSRCPGCRPADVWRDGFDDSAFGTILVPGHMETQGHGQIQYINTLYPWDGHAELRPPEIDWEDCPVGSYVREFDLDPGLRGKRVCVSFQGAEQAIYVWLNGQFVGYAEDSFTPSEFDLTPYIRETGNRLCVEVYKRSSAAWIEDQDFFRFSGIFRPVYLYAKPSVHLEDLWLQAGLEEDGSTGTLSVRLLLDGEAQGARVHAHIEHPVQGVLFDGPLDLAPEGKYLRSQGFRFENVRPWDHDHPELYQVTLTLSQDGETVEVVPYETGFRRFEVKDGMLLLNGERLMLNGVNRHEWAPDTGRAIAMADMTAAMDVFRRNGINAVRTCHYPDQTPWYHLCDRNGIYVMDEADLESHGSWQKPCGIEPSWNVPGSLPEWEDCVVDRARSMFQRDKNHVSILFWSCGNESYAGTCIQAMADYFRAHDPSRVVHYEGTFNCPGFDGISDVESRMYASPQAVRSYLEHDPKKPFLLCEYMHDMGNSLGGMESYVRLGEEFPQYHGGFIWDYMDQALWRTGCDGARALGYGGDFGERQTDYAFSANGIVFADGTEKPAMQEVRYWYSSPEERARHDAANRRAERTLAPLPVKRGRSPLRAVHGDGALGVRGDGFEVLFSYVEGGPVSIRSGGREWLWRAPRPAYWRAPTENDMGCGFAAQSAVWDAADAWQVCEGHEVLCDGPERVSVRYDYTAPAVPGLRTRVTYTIDDTGRMTVDARYHGGPGRPELPLFGLRFATPIPVARVEWLGLSGETYPDRKKGGVFGWHREAPHVPAYLVPQDHGCHMDSRAAMLSMADGAKLTLEMDAGPLAFSAVPYTPQQLEQAAHVEELPEPVRTVVTVCGAMRGVGGINSWGADVEVPYHVSAEEDHGLSFTIWLGR